jgi:hypothetical protein
MSQSIKIGMFALPTFLILQLLPIALGQITASYIKYRQALEKWHSALSTPSPFSVPLSFTPYFGTSIEEPGFADLNDAVKELSSIGANMVPFMVEQIRSDIQAAKSAISIPPYTNYESAVRQNSVYDRLDKDVELMFMLGGIQIRAGMKDPATAPLVPK